MPAGQNEAFSRILIDKALEFSGWDLLNPQQVTFESHTANGREDYLLRDSLGRVLCVLEAKREGLDPYDAKVTALSDKPFKKRFDEESSKKSLGRALFKLRNSQGLTQEQVAEKMNITQSAISRIEHSANDKIRFDDFENYVSALGYKISVSIHPDRNAVQWVKYHAFEIRKHLHQLADLCNGDTKIEGEVAKFFREVTYNMLKIIDDSASKLTNVPLPPKSETLEVITAIPELQPPPQEQPKSETAPVG